MHITLTVSYIRIGIIYGGVNIRYYTFSLITDSKDKVSFHEGSL